MSASNAEVGEYVLISDQQNLLQNPRPKLAIVFYENAVHRRICSLPLTFESINNKAKCICTCVFVCLYKIFVLNEVKYSKIRHRIRIFQSLGALEINA